MCIRASIRGDREDVFSHGFICPKGSTLKQLHDDPDRLRRPVVRRDGPDGETTWEEVTWDEAFAEIERRLGLLAAVDLCGVVAPFAKPGITHSPALWVVAGVFHTRLPAVEEAFVWLAQAAAYFTNQESRPDRAIWVNLELARLYYERDEFARVQEHIDAAAALMRQHGSLPPAHAAFLNYMLSLIHISEPTRPY